MADKQIASKRPIVISGSFTRPLATQVAAQLKVELGKVDLGRFANGEISCRLGQSVRATDVFVFQSHGGSVNEAIMEQAIMIDAAKRASARKVVAVCPFLAYGRQDRKAWGREPIAAKLVVDLLAAAGADHIVSIDLHSGQIQGFFNGPFDHLTAMPILCEQVTGEITIVAPDAGRVAVAEHYARQQGTDLAIVYKRRSRSAGTVEVLEVVGDIAGRRCVLIDDIVDTGGTVVAAAAELQRRGAQEVFVLATHAVFSKPATQWLPQSAIDKLVVTDSLPLKDGARGLDKLEVVSVAPVLAKAIEAIFRGDSVPQLFEAAD